MADASQFIIVTGQPTTRSPIAKNMAYGPSSVNNISDSGVNFRQDRGKAYYRSGKAVKVVPQFKGQKIPVSNSTSAPLPTTTVVSGSQTVATVSYPTGANVSTGNGRIQNVF